MSLDETNTFAGSETATPASDTPAPVDSAVIEEDDGPVSLEMPEVDEAPAEPEALLDGQDEQPTEAVEEFIDFDLDGEIIKAPKKLEGHLLRQADYTRKTQEVAEIKKQTLEVKAQAEALLNVTQEEIQAKSVLVNIDSQLEAYSKVDWEALDNDNPLEAQTQWRRFQQLKESRQQVVGYHDNLVQQRGKQYELETANRLKATAEFAQKNIKGWTPDLDNKITEFAVRDLGYTMDMLKSAYNPQVYRTLYLAHIGQQTLNRQSAPKAAAPVNPTVTLSAKASPAVTKDPADMSMAEYAEWASARERKRK